MRKKFSQSLNFSPMVFLLCAATLRLSLVIATPPITATLAGMILALTFCVFYGNLSIPFLRWPVFLLLPLSLAIAAAVPILAIVGMTTSPLALPIAACHTVAYNLLAPMLPNKYPAHIILKIPFLLRWQKHITYPKRDPYCSLGISRLHQSHPLNLPESNCHWLECISWLYQPHPSQPTCWLEQ